MKKLSEKYDQIFEGSYTYVNDRIKTLLAVNAQKKEEKKYEHVLNGLFEFFPYYISEYKVQDFRAKNDKALDEFRFINGFVELHEQIYNEYERVHFKTIFCDEIIEKQLALYENDIHYDYNALVKRFQSQSGKIELIKNILIKLNFDKAMLGGYRDHLLTFNKDSISVDALKMYLGITDVSKLAAKKADVAVVLNLMDQYDLLEGVNAGQYHKVFSILFDEELNPELLKYYNSYGEKGARFKAYINGVKNRSRKTELADKLGKMAENISREE